MRPASRLRIPAPYVGDMLGNPCVPAAVCWAGYPSICTTSMVTFRSGDTHHFTRGWHAVQWSSRSTRGLGSSGSRFDRRRAAVPFPFGRSPSDEMRQRYHIRFNDRKTSECCCWRMPATGEREKAEADVALQAISLARDQGMTRRWQCWKRNKPMSSARWPCVRSWFSLWLGKR